MKEKATTLKNLLARAAMTLFVMTALATAARAQTPYAVYCDNNTFYFTCRDATLAEDGTFTPDGAADALTITALWSGTAVTASGGTPGWNGNSTVKGSTKTVVFEPSFASVQPTSLARWFTDFSALEKVLGTDYLDTSEATNMCFMFYWCRNLSTLDVSGFDTKKVNDMSYMFQQCQNLTTLDVSGFDTGNVTNMQYMFFACSGLTDLDVSGFDTGNVTSMGGMFSGCSGLTDLDVSGFDTGNVTDMGGMFSYCENLTALDVSGFDTGNVTNMENMFRNCSGLTALDLSGFDTGNVTSMGGMFSGCENLVSIFIGDRWNTDNVEESDNMFDGCESIVGEDGTTYDSSVTDKTKAHADDGGYMRKTMQELTLYDDGDNTDIIASAAPGMLHQVTIEGRSIYADGCWNTICLPFNVSLNTGALTGFRARTLKSAAIEGNTLTLTFGNEVTHLKAGTPYIIKATDKYFDYLSDGFDWNNFDWSYEPYEEVKNPRFKALSFTTPPSELTFADGAVSFIGNFNPVDLAKDDKTILFMGEANTLYYPNEEMTIGSFRAYFKLNNGYTVGEPDSNINSIVLNFGDNATGIIDTDLKSSSQESGIFNPLQRVWFTLDGRRLNGRPTNKGIYINNGRKVVIK
ncbi:MAG: BspA family leucine-rich repeat surface protein [Prevotella sp.]|nr:BspA family leucine-rich repeat surface protein [Prevotella sp.]